MDQILIGVQEKWRVLLLSFENRHKFHDAACQGNLKFCQGIVREMSGNFVSAGVWQPCIDEEPRTLAHRLFTRKPVLGVSD